MIQYSGSYFQKERRFMLLCVSDLSSLHHCTERGTEFHFGLLELNQSYQLWYCDNFVWYGRRSCSRFLILYLFLWMSCRLFLFRRRHGNEKLSPESCRCPDGDPDLCTWQQKNHEDLRSQNQKHRERRITSWVHLSETVRRLLRHSNSFCPLHYRGAIEPVSDNPSTIHLCSWWY